MSAYLSWFVVGFMGGLDIALALYQLQPSLGAWNPFRAAGPMASLWVASFAIATGGLTVLFRYIDVKKRQPSSAHVTDPVSGDVPSGAAVPRDRAHNVAVLNGERTQEHEVGMDRLRELARSGRHAEVIADAEVLERKLTFAGRYDAVREVIELARTAARQASNRVAEVDAQIDLGWSLIQSKQLERALGVLIEGEQQARAIGDAHLRAMALRHWAGYHIAKDDGQRALGKLDEAREAARDIKDASKRSVMDAGIEFGYAQAFFNLRDLAKAKVHCMESKRMYAELEDGTRLMKACALLGQIAEVSGELDEAVREYRDALGLGQAFHRVEEELKCHEGLASVYHQQRRFQLAREHRRLADGLRLTTSVVFEFHRRPSAKLPAAVRQRKAPRRAGRPDQLLCLLRHGTSLKNVFDRHGGPGADLTDAGIKEAVRIIRVLKVRGLRPSSVYYSEHPQIEQTARIVATELRADLVVEGRIRPLHLGVLAGLSREDALRLHKDVAMRMEKWRAGELEIGDLLIPESEPIDAFWSRGQSFLQDVQRRGGTHVIVGSRSILTLLASALLKRTPSLGGGYRHISIPCCGLLTFSRSGDKLKTERSLSNYSV